MSPSRSQILGGIRAALGRGRLDGEGMAEAEERLRAHRRNLIPSRATTLDEAGRIALFIAMAEEVAASVTRVALLDDVPAAVADYLSRQNLPSRLVAAPDPKLDAIPWQ